MRETPAKKAPARVAAATEKGAISRDRLLACAAELFAEHGYAHVGLQEIAKSAGVTKGSLFWHFENKRQIYVECVKQSVQVAFDHSGHRIDDPDPARRLRQYLKWILPSLSNSRVTRRLVLHFVTAQDTELMQELMQGPFGESYEILSRLLRELKPRHDKTALLFFVIAIFVLNDELLELANVWDPKSKKRVGGLKSIQSIETLIKSW